MKIHCTPHRLSAAPPRYGRKSVIISFFFLFVLLFSASAEELPATGIQADNFRRDGLPVPMIRLQVFPAKLPLARVATTYNAQLTASGGSAPYRFAITRGTLPQGISMSLSGRLSGTPKVSGSYTFGISAIDSTRTSFGITSVTMSVSAHSQAGNSEGETKLTISPTTLSAGTVSVSYSAALTASGGSSPYQFSVSAGAVPPGLVLDSAGVLSGKPTVAGSYSFSVNASGSAKKQHGSATISISITADTVLPVGVAISPTSATVSSAGTKQFAATVSNTSNTAVTWTASAGTVSSSGLFSAPSVNSTTSVTVKATSVADGTKSAQATVTVNPPTPVTISITPSLSNVASAKTQQFSATVSNASNSSVTWKSSMGSISSAGLFSAPTVSSSTSATVTATSVADPTKSAQASVTVNPAQTVTVSGTGGDNTYCDAGDVANFGSNDGPAALPQACINTAIANTPSPGNTTPVLAGANLQTALNNAACGDTLQLQAGATFSGLFILPAKNCDSAHWITIRTSAPDASLPAEGTRMTPCYAGVASLPARPALNCASITNALATVQMSPTEGAGPIQFAAGADHYRLIGLEITRPVGTGIVYSLVSVQGDGAADHIILDRMWLHGTAQDDTQRGVELGGMTNFAAVDSFFTDFHCTALTGACTDAQTVNGGLGSLPMASYKIVNNFLEASGENILFGGGGATLTPTDVEVRRNHFYKPLVWMKNQPGFVAGSSGNPFVVKNHFEMKNVQRVLVEGNVFEYSWGGFSQVGYSIVLTPKNQNGLCAACQVTDVTVRYNTISHVSGGFQIANVLSDSGAAATAGHSYSIHDVTVDDIQASGYAGPGVFGLIMMTSPVLHDVTINHVTAFPPVTMLYVGDTTAGSPMGNFVFTNNVMTTGPYPVWSTGGGTANCASSDVPLTTINGCFSAATFTANALITSAPLSQWPTGDFVASSTSNVQFANFNGGVSGDYTLLSSSPYISAGTDGKPLGADTNAIATATSGVY